MDDHLDIVIGTPGEQLDDWQHQQLPDSCAVVSELSIINQFGYNLTEEEAASISSGHGWYRPGTGTRPADIGRMMDLFNIPNHQVTNATVADLARELRQGHGVIVSVRSCELWDEGPLASLMQFLCKAFGFDNATYNPADHAVVVTGIDVSDPSNPMVIINDSGVPDGAGKPYPLDKFVDAWENGNFYYTATDIPMKSNDMEALGNFDWGGVSMAFVQGAVGTFAGLTYMSETGDIAGGVEVAIAAGSLVEKVFQDPGSIDLI